MSERHRDPARLAALAIELQTVHAKLRRALQIAREAVEDGDPAAPTRDLLLYCWGFCEALDGHHRSEDAALFPRIIDVRPELAPVIANLKQDHSMIDHLLGGFRKALESGASQDEQLRHLDGIEAVMETHFGYEERQLIGPLADVDATDLDRAAAFGPLAD